MKNFTLLFLLLFQIAVSQEKNEPQGIQIGDLVTMSGHWFMAYRDGIDQVQADASNTERTHSSSIYLKRSYITLKKELSPIYSVRYTQDITIDKEGSDAGNVETRLKYLYLKAKPNIPVDWLSGTWIEVGMVHRPWLDYEQKINTYRVQDNMAIERNRIFNSADFGVSIGGNIGAEMDKDFVQNVNGAMKGKYLSYVIGLYNGGGYSGSEKNTNKVIAGRLSYRPFPNHLPALQMSTYFNMGKGNTEDSPNFNQWLGFLAWTGQRLTLTAQYHKGEGDFRGEYVDENDPGKALKNSGYSFFGEYHFGRTPWAIFGRHDRFELKDETPEVTQRYIGGIAYRISDNIRLILDTEYDKNESEKNNIYELNVEIVF